MYPILNVLTCAAAICLFIHTFLSKGGVVDSPTLEKQLHDEPNYHDLPRPAGASSP